MSEEIKNEIERQLQFGLEEEKLKEVIEIINEEILKCIERRQYITNTILEYRKNILEEYKDDEDKIIEYFDHENYIKEESFRSTDKKLKELTILKPSPYFGKITFREEDFGIEDIYVGRFGVTLEETFEPLVVDWRAPIAALFYNGVGNEGHYTAPDGEVYVSILGRIQYIIKKGKLEGLFNSNIEIKDDMLQMVLSKNSSDKLKDIIMTIQKEQDDIIRQDKNKIVVVDGVAGSGKTTIALHRVAYLIYNYRKLIENKVLILGPNRIFIDYISNVLPTLGETGVYQTTFLDLALEMVDVDDAIDIKAVMERILSGDTELEQAIKYKRSLRFKEDLDKLIGDLETNGYDVKDVIFKDKVIVSEAEIKKMLHTDLINLPLFRRAKKIKRILFSKIRDARDEAFREIESWYKEKKASYTQDELLLELNNLDFERRLKIRDLISLVMEVKNGLKYLDEEVIENIYESFNGHNDYTEDDLVGILYLKVKLKGLKVTKEIKHLVIDEAQDYSPLQFEVLRALTNTKSMTIVGDSNQQLLPNEGESSLKALPKIFAEELVEVFKLNKSYRSTKEIMEYSNRYLNDTSIVPMVRTGEPVEEVVVEGNEKVQTAIINAVNNFKASGLENIAIISRDLTSANKWFKLIESQVSARLIEKENVHLNEGVMVMPSYYAKGLEFDGAIIIDEEMENQFKDNLMYIMCTRALHRLQVIKNQ